MYHYLDPNPNGSPLVLFLHGLGADSEMWVYQLAELAKSGMRPVALDLPGFGKTPMENGQWPRASQHFCYTKANQHAELVLSAET